MESRLTKLPVELFSIIFAHFSAIELTRLVGPVSKAFRRLSQLDSVWGELIDRDGIRSFLRRLDRRERIYLSLNKTPSPRSPSYIRLTSFLLRKPLVTREVSASGPEPIASYHHAYQLFCSATYNASNMLGTPHQCCPNGHHPNAITDDVSNQLLGSSGSVFTLAERLWSLFEDWLLRNGMLAHYLSLGDGSDQTPLLSSIETDSGLPRSADDRYLRRPAHASASSCCQRFVEFK